MNRDYKTPTGAAPPDWRGLCEELLEALDGWQLGGAPPEDDAEQELIDRARLALAQSEPEVAGPSDGEPPPGPFSEHDLRQQWNQQADEFNQWDSLDSSEQLAWAQVRAIAADLLERQAAPVPVAVSERLPGPEDCNGDEEVWAWRPFDSESDMDGGDFWSLSFHEWLEDEDCGFTHWLPFNTLPLPTTEPQS